MALNDFKQHYDNAYETVFNKVLVAKEVANTRFEPTLRYGESVTRPTYDISAVLVRNTVRHSDSTIDTVTDSEELMTINLEKEIAFRMSDGELVQAGPLNPMEVIGRQAAVKLAEDLDYEVFKLVTEAAETFDEGDLTTLASTGAAIELSSTNVPKMASRLSAKLMRKGNQTLSNLVGVFDAYAASDITQYLMGKDIDLAGSAFRNGFAGTVTPMAGASIYVSENLMGEVTVPVGGAATADDTITILGVTFTAKAAPDEAGEFDVHTTADGQGAIYANMINGSATGQDSATGYYEVSAANRAILRDAKVVASYDTAGDVLTITAAGRIIFAETLTTNPTVVNKLHCYFGKRGGIDLVTQDKSEVDVRPESKQRASIIFSSYLAGVKVFADSAKTFLDVHVKVV
jgi:hypothetical protein